MENKNIIHPLPHGTKIEFMANKFFIQGEVLDYSSNGFKYVYSVVGGRGGTYIVTEEEVVAISKLSPTSAIGANVLDATTKDMVNHPTHYGGKDNPMEVIKIIDHYKLPFSLGNTLKYILRSDKKGNKLEDLKKAAWYLQHEITKLEHV